MSHKMKYSFIFPKCCKIECKTAQIHTNHNLHSIFQYLSQLISKKRSTKILLWINYHFHALILTAGQLYFRVQCNCIRLTSCQPSRLTGHARRSVWSAPMARDTRIISTNEASNKATGGVVEHPLVQRGISDRRPLTGSTGDKIKLYKVPNFNLEVVWLCYLLCCSTNRDANRN